MQDMTASLKQKDEFRLGVLRMLAAALQNAYIEKHSRLVKAGKPAEESLTDDETVAIVEREVKRRLDAASEYEKANRSDLAKRERDEAALLDPYVPERMSVEDVRAAVSKVVEAMPSEDKAQWGKVMQALSKELKGKADMQRVSEIARSLLEAQ